MLVKILQRNVDYYSIKRIRECIKMNNYYSTYVRHCLKFYARYPAPIFNSKVDKKNWLACERVFKQFSDKEQEMLIKVYREGDTLADNVYQISKEKDIKQSKIWKMMERLERNVAKCRGLL